jgi:hypothetical protein
MYLMQPDIARRIIISFTALPAWWKNVEGNMEKKML